MTASERQIPILAILLVLCLGMTGAYAGSSSNELTRPQKPPSLDKILDTLTDTDLDREGLDQSNIAIDQFVQRSNRLIGKASKQRSKELKGKNSDSPLSKLLGQAIVALTDSNSYLLKLKELQKTLIAVQSPADRPDIDPGEARKDLDLHYKAFRTDLQNLKLGVRTLPLGQRAIVDVLILDMGSKLNSAIQRIQRRALQVGMALTLESETDLNAR
jgi:hypothetical protein